MKNYLKNALIGALLGLMVIPVTLMELYYWGGNNAYLTEIVYFDNFQMMVLSTIIYGCLIGILLTFSNFIKKVKYINEDLKNVLQVFIVVILVTVVLYVFPYFNLSEIVNKLIIFNTVILIIIIIVSVLIYNSIQINKINKKIKE